VAEILLFWTAVEHVGKFMKSKLSSYTYDSDNSSETISCILKHSIFPTQSFGKKMVVNLPLKKQTCLVIFCFTRDAL